MKIINVKGENIFISSELLDEFQCNFQESCGLLKVTKKAGFHPLSRKHTFGETIGGIKLTAHPLHPPPHTHTHTHSLLRDKIKIYLALLRKTFIV